MYVCMYVYITICVYIYIHVYKYRHCVFSGPLGQQPVCITCLRLQMIRVQSRVRLFQFVYSHQTSRTQYSYKNGNDTSIHIHTSILIYLQVWCVRTVGLEFCVYVSYPSLHIEKQRPDLKANPPNI